MYFSLRVPMYQYYLSNENIHLDKHMFEKLDQEMNNGKEEISSKFFYLKTSYELSNMSLLKFAKFII